MPRRLLLLVAPVLLVALTGAGCADDVSPAARIGDVSVGEDALMEEVTAWAASATLLEQLQAGSTAAPGGRGYSTEFVDFVLTNRISFELHNEEFAARGLDVSAAELADVRAQLFGDPAVTESVLAELGDPYAEELVADVARQFELQTVLAEGYADWAAEAFTRDDIEVNPRYGTWDGRSGSVIGPEGPRSAPGGDLLVEL